MSIAPIASGENEADLVTEAVQVKTDYLGHRGQEETVAPREFKDLLGQ